MEFERSRVIGCPPWLCSKTFPSRAACAPHELGIVRCQRVHPQVHEPVASALVPRCLPWMVLKGKGSRQKLEARRIHRTAGRNGETFENVCVGSSFGPGRRPDQWPLFLSRADMSAGRPRPVWMPQTAIRLPALGANLSIRRVGHGCSVHESQSAVSDRIVRNARPARKRRAR